MAKTNIQEDQKAFEMGYLILDKKFLYYKHTVYTRV